MTIRRTVRRRVLGAVLLLLVVGAWQATRALASRRARWAVAVKQDLVSEIEFAGVLKAVDSSVVAVPVIPQLWEFKISFMVPEGSEVRKGQPILGFDTSSLVRELEQKKAESDSAKTDMEKTQADLRLQTEKDQLALAEAEARLRKLGLKLDVPKELVASNDLKLGELDRQIAREEVAYIRSKIVDAQKAGDERIAAFSVHRRRAESRVSEIQSQIEQLSVKSPRSGTVLYVSDWRGEKRKAGDATWRSQQILEIPNLSAMFARGDVDEADAGVVAVGQRVRLRLDAHPDDEFFGRVSKLAGAVVRQSPRNPLKVLQIEVRLDRTDQARMRPGMRFRGVIERDRIPGAVLVPVDAVVMTSRGPVVYREGLGAPAPVSVTTGGRNARWVEIKAGVRPGDSVRLAESAEAVGP